MDNGDYPWGWNAYVAGRQTGEIDARGNLQTSGKRMADHTAKNLLADIANLLNWGEQPLAHPVQGVIAHDEYQVWHIDELYREALVKGYWTQEYFATGIAQSLVGGFIDRKIREGLACLHFLTSEGFIAAPSVPPTFDLKQHSLLAANASFQKLRPAALRKLERKYRTRQRPGDYDPVSIEELKSFLRAVTDTAVRLALLIMIIQGLRLNEVVENALIPGTVYRRPTRYDQFRDPTYPTSPYLLSFSGQRDLMTGVMPPVELAFQPDAKARKACKNFILGKGPKTRRVDWRPFLVRALWRYYKSERSQILKDNGIEAGDAPAEFLLNRYGQPLTADLIYRACVAASDACGATTRITPHVLRHTFACLYLETAIIGLAKKDGVARKDITIEHISRYGSRALLPLKKILGHSLLKTTETYLERLSTGVIQMQMIEVFENLTQEFM